MEDLPFGFLISFCYVRMGYSDNSSSLIFLIRYLYRNLARRYVFELITRMIFGRRFLKLLELHFYCTDQ